MWFFRFHLANGFTLFSGDRYDAMIAIAIEQHWQNVLEGREAWSRVAYFAPVADSIGYNDGYLLYGLLYTLFHRAGLPLVAAAEAVHAVMRLTGFAGMLALLSGPVGCRWRWALFGAALFAIADVSLRHVNHAQLLTVAFVPWCALLLWRAVAALLAGQRGRLIGHGIGFVALFALWISTAYYLAWFFAFFVLIAAAVGLVVIGRQRRRDVRTSAVRHWRNLLLIAAVGLVLLLPFLSVYLPKALETGTHGFSGVSRTTLSPLDFVNPGAANLIWSPLFAPLHRWGLTTNTDLIFGLGPLLTALAMLAIWRQRRAAEPAGLPLRIVALALAVAWLLLFRLWVVTPWFLVTALVPGASALRVIGRFQLVLLVPAIVLVVRWLDGERRRWLAIGAAGLLLLEQGAVTAAPVHLDQQDQLALINGTPSPPPDCAAFAVRSTRPYPYPRQDAVADGIYAHNVEAMTLAEAFARPTVNGFSTFNPPGWNLADPEAPDYLVRVRDYVARYGVTHLCLLDRRRGILWQPIG